jgi:two-component system NarL family response regulator
MTTPRDKLHIVIADDHPVFRGGLRNLLNQQPDMQVVGEAGDGEEVVAICQRTRPDVTLLDLRMPVADGPRAIAALVAHDPDARIIVLTTYDGDEDIYRAVRAGARGYLLKDTFPEGILSAIRHVAAGGQLFPEAVAAKLAGRRSDAGLTTRELSVLELVARGLTNREIQTALGMAEGTLKNHLKRIFEKLEVTDRTEAALVAVKRGVIALD